MVKLDSAWLKEAKTEEEREELIKNLYSNKKVLDKILHLVYNMRTSREKVTLKDYDNPSWSHKQAHLNGEVAAFRRIESLLTIGDEE